MPQVAFADQSNEKEYYPTGLTFTSTTAPLTTSFEDSSGLLDDGGGGGKNFSNRNNAFASSLRSVDSYASTGSSRSTAKSPSLRGNLTRQHQNRNPMTDYKQVKVLGEGSMGMVCQVRKRTHRIGGSARYNLKARQAEQEKWDACFSLPLGLGRLLKHFFGRKASLLIEQASLSGHENTSTTTTSGGGGQGEEEEDASESAGTTSVGSYAAPVLAMKSIHLKLIRNQTFIDELQNEIAILKTLDNPHIVRVIETYNHANAMYVVMELCSGGDLYTRDPYTEDQAARIVHSILSAVAYMHSKGV